MKLIRETLLNRHRDDSPKLDEIRTAVIDRELLALRKTSRSLIGEMLTLRRLLWGSLASAWVVIVALNFSAGTFESSQHAGQLAGDATAQEVLEGMQRYHAQLALLLEGGSLNEPEDAMEPNLVPGPRSDATRPKRFGMISNRQFV